MNLQQQLDLLMNDAWPALEQIPVDGWIVRAAHGVTQRANSVLPVDGPLDVTRTLEKVQQLYAERGLPSTFQISPVAQPVELDGILAARRYETRSPTLVQTAPTGAVSARTAPLDAAIVVHDEPDDPWLDLWWTVDGRGGPAEREIARRILTGAPARYATMYDAVGVAAVGRLALTAEWAGLYCMAVRPDARRRGHARRILHALARTAVDARLESMWLQVVEANEVARALYGHAGFVTASRYHYRTLTAPSGSVSTTDSRRP